MTTDGFGSEAPFLTPGLPGYPERGAGIETGDWNGALDELRVYNYALSPEQVASDSRGP